MNKLYIALLSTIAITGLSACGGADIGSKAQTMPAEQSQQANHQAVPLTEDNTVEMLFELDRQFVQYRLENGTHKAFLKFLTEDAVTLPAGVVPKIGIEAILSGVVDVPGTTVTWEPQAGDISGELGYTWGFFSINTEQDDGSINKQNGKYITVWKRQENNEWKVVVESFSMNSAPQ